MVLAAIVVYAVLLTTASLTGNSAFSVFAIVMLLAVLLWPALKRANPVAWLFWSVSTVSLLVALVLGVADKALELLPVLINSVIAWLFARSLFPGREALISRMVRLVESDTRLEQPGVRSYTCRLTLFWAVILTVQALLLLTAWWLLHVWGLIQPGTLVYTWLHAWLRFGNYAVIGLLFVLEYGWRRISLRNVEHMGFFEVTGRIARCWPELLQGKHS